MNILKRIAALTDKLFGLDVQPQAAGVGHIYMQVNDKDGRRVVTGSRTTTDPHGDFRIMTQALELSQAAGRGQHFKPYRVGNIVIQPHVEGFGSGLPSTDEQIHILHLAYWPMWDFDVFKHHTRKFEQWYVENCFDLANSPLGSRDCMLQRKAWFSSIEENKQ